MTVRVIDVNTGEETTRHYTQDEIDAFAAAQAEHDAVIASTPKKPTLEDVIEVLKQKNGGFEAALDSVVSAKNSP